MNLDNYIEKIIQKAGLNQSKFLNNPSYDIIVPVYNGFNTLQKCVDSLLKYTNTRHNIIFYNDNSTDSKVKPWLDTLANNHSFITAIHNPSNLGYLANVNSAMQSGSNDVILLNADTSVTKNWLNELNLVASDKNIALVCPLSDNATILTLGNSLINKINELKSFSGKWYPIPTAVGSCMLIKRTIINKFGGFDEYYQPGYGEECDYSMRLRLAGYDIACAPASFVFHSGSASFVENATLLKQQHQKLLDLRWPQYNQEVESFLENNPIRIIEEFLYNTDKKNTILHIVHGLESKGGVELFTLELLHSLTENFHTVLVPSQQNISGHTVKIKHYADNIRAINYQFSNRKNQIKIADRNADLYQQELDIQFVRQLIYGNHDVVHFHSLVGLGSLIWPLFCQKLGIPYLLSVHDHFSICTNFSLLTNKYTEYCNKIYCNEKDQDCCNCLTDMTSYSQLTSKNYIQQRNLIWHQIIKYAKHVIVPNQYLDNVLISKYGAMVQPKLLHVEPYFYPEKTLQFRKKHNNILKVAFLGTFSFEKGAQLFLKAFENLGSSNVEWHIIGKIHPFYQNQLEQVNILCSGTYDRKNLTKLLSSIDLVILPSLHPETYGITLTEAWLHKIPVICSDIGAYEHRVDDGNNGILFSSGDSLALQASIENIIKNPALLTHMQNYITTSNIQSRLSDKNKISHAYKQFIRKPINISKFQNICKNIYNNTKKNHFPMPVNNAYQIMHKWLHSELTLEAESDWLAAIDIDIFIVAKHQNYINISHKSCLDYAPKSRVIIANEELKNLSPIVCILYEGQVLNDNFGNWVDNFQKSNKLIGLADFALIDWQLQPYAPQFLAGFDELSYLNQKSRIGAFLYRHNKERPIDNQISITKIIDELIKNNRTNDTTNDIHYFPHLSYLYNDVLWATQWKQELKRKYQKSIEQNTNSISIFILTIYKKPAIESILKSYTKQKNITIKHIYVFSPQPISFDFKGIISSHFVDFQQLEAFINPVVKRDQSHALLFINDNVILTDDYGLQKLNNCLNWHNIHAISPVCSNDNNLLFANKVGNGLVSGRGVVRNLHFDNHKLPQASQLLDEDCFLISKYAWNKANGFSKPGNIYYRATQLSQQLHKLNIVCALLPDSEIVKRNLPSHCQLQNEPSLTVQRQDLFQQNKEFYLNASHYSKAYNSLESIELDTSFGTFKTPKNLPRILAYANDSWASGFYRVKAPLSALAASNQVSCHFLPEKMQKVTASYFEINKQQPDTLLLHNFLTSNQLFALKQYRAYLDIPVVLSIDDLLTEIPSYNPFAQSNPESIEENIKHALLNVDRLIVTTNFLANKFAHLHNDIVVIKNMLPKELWQHSLIINQKNSKIRVDWAGAAQHYQDLHWLQPVINATKDLVDWVFYGDKPDNLDDIIEFHPHTSLSERVFTLLCNFN